MTGVLSPDWLEEARDSFVILAIDPGLSGALAFYYPIANVVRVYDMPSVENEIDAAALVCHHPEASPYRRRHRESRADAAVTACGQRGGSPLPMPSQRRRARS